MNLNGTDKNLSMSLSNAKASIDSAGNLYARIGYEIAKYNFTSKTSNLIYLTDVMAEMLKKMN